MLTAVWFAVWFAVNTLPFGVPVFDPFPFGLLTMIVSLEAIFLSCFVLISKNRQTEFVPFVCFVGEKFSFNNFQKSSGKRNKNFRSLYSIIDGKLPCVKMILKFGRGDLRFIFCSRVQKYA